MMETGRAIRNVREWDTTEMNMGWIGTHIEKYAKTNTLQKQHFHNDLLPRPSQHRDLHFSNTRQKDQHRTICVLVFLVV